MKQHFFVIMSLLGFSMFAQVLEANERDLPFIDDESNLKKAIIQKSKNHWAFKALLKPHFPKVKTLDSFDFTKLPKLNKQKILNFANCEFIEKAENIIMLGNAGTGKTHLAVALGVAACQKNISVHFTSAAKLANDLMEARDELSLSRLHNKLSKHKLLIIDEIGYVPLSNTGAELMYDIINQRYETSSLIMTTNLQFSDWVQVFKSDKLTAALLDRITHHSNIIEMNGDSYRFTENYPKF